MIKRLYVSCQAVEGEPLYGLNIMHHMARAAKEGGATGIRANGVSDIISIKAEVDLPVIGIIKAIYSGSDVYITPTIKEVKELLTSGCDIIALDATHRARPNGEQLVELVRYIREHAPDVEIMADISNYEEAVDADRMGFDYIGSTMRGYTPYTKGINLPDIAFLSQMVSTLKARIIAEGGIWETGQLREVLRTGVYAVVIGSAITRPRDITARFAQIYEE